MDAILKVIAILIVLFWQAVKYFLMHNKEISLLFSPSY